MCMYLINSLHWKAAALGHVDICNWIIQKNQSTVSGVENKHRTPLFYATVPTDGGDTWDLLVNKGADPKHTDKVQIQVSKHTA